MVLNLRRRIPSIHNVFVYDSNIQAAEKVASQANGKITIVSDPAVISQSAVLLIFNFAVNVERHC
jgi:hypothetical protein